MADHVTPRGIVQHFSVGRICVLRDHVMLYPRLILPFLAETL